MKLLAQLRRQAVQQRLHDGRLLLHLLDELFQALGRVVPEQVAVLVHEPLEVRLAPGHLLREHLVQLPDHLLHARHLFRAHISDLVVDVFEEGVHHRLLQHLHQLFELGPRLRVHELVVLQLLNLAADILRQVVDRLLLLLDDVLQHLRQALLLLGRGLLLRGLHRLLERLQRAVAALKLTLRLLQAAVQRPLLQLYHLVQPLLDVLEHGVQVVAVQHLASLLAQLLEDIPQPLHPLAHRVAHPALQQVAQGVLEVAEVHQVIGQPGQDIVRVQGPDLLAAVPFRVAEAESHIVSRTVWTSVLPLPVPSYPLYWKRPAILSLFSRLFRCNPSSTNSTAEAMAGLLRPAPSFSAAASNPSTCFISLT